MSALLAGPAAGQSPSPADEVVFTIGTLEDMVSANPFSPSAYAEVNFLIYDQLFNFGQEDLSPVSGLAIWPPQHSADYKTWTFTIRSGVKWSDGVPLTAKDIAFTFNFINEKNLSSYITELGAPIKHDAFVAPNDTTLVWHMAIPTLTPENPPWVPIFPEHIWGKYWNATAQAIKQAPNIPAVGSGPFVLTQWKPGQYWTFEANKEYWGGAPHIDGIVFRVYQNAEALKLALTTGEIDAANGIPPTIFQGLDGDPNVTMVVGEGSLWDNLAFNFQGSADPSLHNLDVRTAIEYSIDKQALAQRVALGYATPGTSVIAPDFPRWHWEPPPDQVIGYDPQKAAGLLDAAGYKDINGDGLRETPSGQPWSLEIVAISDWMYSVPEAKLIAGWMNDAGMETTVQTVSESKAYDIWGAQDFDMYVWAWGTEPDPDFMMSIFTSDQCLSWSDGCYSNPAFDKMYEQQHTMLDMAQRQALITKMQQFLYQQVPEIVLLNVSQLQAYRNDRFTGFVRNPTDGGPIFYASGPYSYLSIRPVSAEVAGGSGAHGGGFAWAWVALVAILVGVASIFITRARRTRSDNVE